MQVTTAGSGPLVLLCHGFPELSHSWRHQVAALAAAGCSVAAPDMRGYGGTEAPAEIEQYTLLHLVGDMVDLVRVLGQTQAVVVGHDWGAAVAWHCALLRPDLFRAVAGLSVPYAPPGKVDLITALENAGIHDFYMQYFQAPGVAEAELDADPAASIRRIHWSGSGDAPARSTFGRLGGGGLLANTSEPPQLPGWLSAADLEVYAAAFRASGFRGGLNWYRNLRRNTALLSPWRGQPIRQPSLFIAGTRDDVLKFPASQAQIDAYPRTLPGLRGCHLIDGAGHWIQRERADAVNALLIEFLRGL
ncbi:MAG: alpha/beta hydrolase [Rubrivivax sp.]|nr:alpha/beta hydrolase [Rubrivivax sp.]